MSLRNNHIGNLTCHLNVPYGPVVREEHLTRAFRDGSAANIPDETERAIVLSVFVEASLAMILSSAREAAADAASCTIPVTSRTRRGIPDRQPHPFSSASDRRDAAPDGGVEQSPAANRPLSRAARELGVAASWRGKTAPLQSPRAAGHRNT